MNKQSMGSEANPNNSGAGVAKNESEVLKRQLDIWHYEQAYRRLDIKAEDIVDKVFVDIGSGMYSYLCEGLKKIYPQAKIITVDRRFIDGWVKPDVIADASDLPFESDSIDTIVAHHSVPVLEKEGGHPVETMREMFRVLKPGGILKIVPFSASDEFIDFKGEKYSGRKILDILQSENTSFHYRYIYLEDGDERLEIEKKRID